MKLRERQGLTKTLPPTALSLTDGVTHLNSRDVFISGDTHDMPALRISAERVSIDTHYVERAVNAPHMTYRLPTLDELFGYSDSEATESVVWERSPRAVRIEILE